MRISLYISLLSVFASSGECQVVDCSAVITSEFNVGLSAGVYVGVNISASNTTSNPIDGVTWIMKSRSGEILFNETWVGSPQKNGFGINPQATGVIPIAPGSTVALVPLAPFNRVEFLVRDTQDSDDTTMQRIFDEKLEVTKTKYSDVTCEIIGFVEDINF